MGFTNSPLVSYTCLSPNHYGARGRKIDTITPHVVVGQLPLETIGAIFAQKSAKASSNYGLDKEGKVGMFVEEQNASWCSSSESNDRRAITIEIASDKIHPYAITNAAMDGLIELCVDVCKRNEIPKLLWKADKTLIGKVAKQNITVHRWFKNKACPGEYVYSRLGEVAEDVNRLLVPSKPEIVGQTKIKVNVDVLRYRRGPGTNHPIVGQVRKGEVYTIVQEAFGLGASKWGKLSSGAGWIALDHCIVVR